MSSSMSSSSIHRPVHMGYRSSNMMNLTRPKSRILNLKPLRRSKVVSLRRPVVLTLRHGDPVFIGSLSQYTSIIVEEDYNEPVDFTTATRVKYITVDSDPYNHPINMKNMVSLEHLVINSAKFNKPLYLTHARKLKTVCIIGGFNQSINTEDNPDLQELTVEGAYSHPVNVRSNPKLRSLSLNCKSNYPLALHNNLELNSLTTKGDFNHELNLSRNIAIQSINIGGIAPEEPKGNFNKHIIFDPDSVYVELTDVRIGGKFNRPFPFECLPNLQRLTIAGHYNRQLDLTTNAELLGLRILGSSYKVDKFEHNWEKRNTMCLNITNNPKLIELHIKPAVEYPLALTENIKLKVIRLDSLLSDIDLRNNLELTNINIKANNIRYNNVIVLHGALKGDPSVKLVTDMDVDYQYDTVVVDSDVEDMDGEDMDGEDSDCMIVE